MYIKFIIVSFCVLFFMPGYGLADNEGDISHKEIYRIELDGETSGCKVNHTLVSNSKDGSVDMTWKTSTLCGDVVVYSDSTVFSEVPMKTWIYILHRAIDWAAYAKEHHITDPEPMFSWDKKIIATVVTNNLYPETDYDLEIVNVDLVGDQATPLIIRNLGGGEDNSALKLSKSIYGVLQSK